MPTPSQKHCIDTSQPTGNFASDPSSLNGTCKSSDKPYTIYTIKIVYRNSTGRMQIATGGVLASTLGLNYLGQTVALAPSSPQSIIVDLTMPLTAIDVHWTASRTGLAPLAPSPVSIDPNWQLLDYNVTPDARDFLADMETRDYQISGLYSYGALYPVQPGTHPITMGNLPFDLSPSLENKYLPIDFSQAILDPDRIIGPGDKPEVNPKWKMAKPGVIP